MADGTVLVNLRKDWFGPDGSLYQARDNPHEFPEGWAAPPEKQKADKEKKADESTQNYAVLPSSAELVQSDTTVAVLQNTGGGQQAMVSSAVQDGAKSVGGALGEHVLEEASQSTGAAAKVAKDVGLDQVGGKPRESGPLPAGTKKPA